MELAESARADSVRAFFVFLDLLKGKAEHIAQVGLAHLQLDSERFDARTDMYVNGVVLFGWLGWRHDEDPLDLSLRILRLNAIAFRLKQRTGPT